MHYHSNICLIYTQRWTACMETQKTQCQRRVCSERIPSQPPHLQEHISIFIINNSKYKDKYLHSPHKQSNHKKDLATHNVIYVYEVSNNKHPNKTYKGLYLYKFKWH